MVKDDDSSATDLPLHGPKNTAGEMSLHDGMVLVLAGEMVGIVYPHPRDRSLAGKIALEIAARWNTIEHLKGNNHG